MDFRVLGPLEILERCRNIVPTAPKPRQVIALLLLRRNTLVQTSELIDELWEEEPPASAMTTLQTYVYKIRKILLRCDAGDILFTRPGGYLLTVPDSGVDLHRFEGAAGKGKALLEGGDPAHAAEALREALAMWRGCALVDVTPGRLLSSYVTRLEEFRARTLDLRIEADLQLGRHQELVSELKSLVLSRPLHENVHASLMIALYRSGRRHEALELYQILRRNMIDDLGLEPGQELRALHQALLLEDPVGLPFEPQQTITVRTEKEEDVAPRPAPAGIPAPLAAPAQLPADLADFTGHMPVIEQIPHVFGLGDAGGRRRTAIPVAVVTGMPGAGKTALAVHMAHRLRPHFDSGQLYVDLRGSTGDGMDPADALHGFLRALGVPETQVPDDREERCKLFRSTTVGRRLLVVLDDAASLADVSLLLPADPQCGVIVTSRRRLHGPGGAWNVGLDGLSHDESLELLTRIIGPERVEREWQAADQLVGLVGGLPLAVRCIGGRLNAAPGLPLTAMADQLAGSEPLLDELRLGDIDMRSLYDSCYGRLTRVEQSVFRLLSILPAPEFRTESVAELLGSDTKTVTRLLERFVDGHLIRVVRWDHDADEVLYAFPELIRAYARGQLMRTLTRHHDVCRGAESLAAELVPASGRATAEDGLRWADLFASENSGS
ncbi:AfsR/SARP family transcriptional regulator [Streptomyces sp. NPDC020801]|uniref:AfsR/SARP family transcriptional regulator n=1 Tax=unclassified Streptomyces TaxID=2593676 RepID=UPI0037957031